MAATENKVISLSALVPEDYDEVLLSYTGDNLTGVVFKRKAQILVTLTLEYTGDDLTRIVRS